MDPTGPGSVILFYYTEQEQQAKPTIAMGESVIQSYNLLFKICVYYWSQYTPGRTAHVSRHAHYC